MYIDFSKLFHRASKDSRDGGRVHIPRDSAQWPDAWKTTFYKAYKSLPSIILSHSDLRADLFSTIVSRTSRRGPYSETLSKDELATILLYSCGKKKNNDGTNRAQPSGGGRYPIEAYVLMFRSLPDVPAGIYHYNVENHTLERLAAKEFTKEDIARLFSYEWIQDSSAAIVLTSAFERTKMKYGQRGYRYAMLEAGHIGQNICLISQALNVQCCPMGGSFDEGLENILGIDGEDESLVYTLVLGK